MTRTSNDVIVAARSNAFAKLKQVNSSLDCNISGIYIYEHKKGEALSSVAQNNQKVNLDKLKRKKGKKVNEDTTNPGAVEGVERPSRRRLDSVHH